MRALRVITAAGLASALAVANRAPYEYSCVDGKVGLDRQFCNQTLGVVERARAFAAALSADEVMTRMNSEPSPGIPGLNASGAMWNGPENVHGITTYCIQLASGQWRCPTIFPSPPHMAATMNASDFRAWAAVTSSEQRAVVNNHGTRVCCNNASIGLSARGPVLNVAAHPRWGRNHNSPGEDRHLIGVFGAQAVRGLQQGHPGEDVGTAPDGTPYIKILSELKHFAAYEVEADRFAFVDNLTWFDLNDTFLPAFERTVRDANPMGYMCSYPAARIGGAGQPAVPFCASATFAELARSWGFGGGGFDGPGGFIESDCGALENIQTRHHYVATLPEAAAVAAKDGRVDLNCGSVFTASGPLSQALQAGLVSDADLRASSVRTTSALMLAGAFDHPFTSQPLASYGYETHFGLPESAALSRDQARRGYVLLRNPGGALPLPQARPGSTMLVVGPLGNDTTLSGDYIAQLCPGGTTSCVKTVAAALADRHGAAGTVFVQGCDDVHCQSLPGLGAAVAAAKTADVVVVAVGDSVAVDREGTDRTSVALPGRQAELAVAVLRAAAARSVLLVLSGETVGLEPLLGWGTHAVAAGFYPGPHAAPALVDALYGADASGAELANLWGRSPIAWMPSNYTDLVPPGTFGVAPGPTLGLTYRWYAGPVVAPFGTGLSYSTFNVTRPGAGRRRVLLRRGAEGSVAVTVQNTGERRAAAVVMLYASAASLDEHASQAPPSGTAAQALAPLPVRPELAGRPHRACPGSTPVPLPSLFGFARVIVAPGESQHVDVPVDARSMEITGCDGRRDLRAGTYTVHATTGAPPSPDEAERGDGLIATLRVDESGSVRVL